MESLKTKSRITTFIVAVIFGVITYIAAMNPDNLAVYLGVYGSYAPLIIIIAGMIVKQYSEDSRVKRAEQLVHQQYTVIGYPKESETDNNEPTITIKVDADEVLDAIQSKQEKTSEPDDTEMNNNTDEIHEEDIFTKEEDDVDDYKT